MRLSTSLHEVSEIDDDWIWVEERLVDEETQDHRGGEQEFIDVPLWYSILSRFRKKPEISWEPTEEPW
jgi:hypothetical protein